MPPPRQAGETSTLPARSQKPPSKAETGGRDGGVLQFNKVEDRGLARQDLRQMSSMQRLVWFVVALAVAVGLFYVAMRMTSS